MTTRNLIMHYGNLGMTTDFRFLINGSAPHGMVVDIRSDVEIPEHEGYMTIAGGIDPRANRLSREVLVAEKIIAHEAIAQRAYEISTYGTGGSAEGNWLQAERELLGESAERVLSHGDIAHRAREIAASGTGGSDHDNWVRALRELAGV